MASNASTSGAGLNFLGAALPGTTGPGIAHREMSMGGYKITDFTTISTNVSGPIFRIGIPN